MSSGRDTANTSGSVRCGCAWPFRNATGPHGFCLCPGRMISPSRSCGPTGVVGIGKPIHLRWIWQASNPIGSSRPGVVQGMGGCHLSGATPPRIREPVGGESGTDSISIYGLYPSKQGCKRRIPIRYNPLSRSPINRENTAISSGSSRIAGSLTGWAWIIAEICLANG